MSFIQQFKRQVANLLALLGLLCVISLVTTIQLTRPLITESGYLSSTLHTGLVVIVTILATIFSALIASRLRHLLLNNLDMQIRKTTNLLRGTPVSESDLSRLDRRWRGVLSIDSISEKSHNLPVFSAYLFCALMTTTIVTTFTPVADVRKLDYHPIIPDANYIFNDSCAYMVDGPFNDNRSYSWSLPNGSHFFVPANAGGCPTRDALVLAGNVNPVSPQDFAYSDMGVAVRPGAIAAPVSIYSSHPQGSPPLQDLLTKYGTNLLNTTQCVPVMEKTPFQCQRGGTLEVGGEDNQTLTAFSADGQCNSSLPFYFVNVTTTSAQINFVCTADGENSIGQGTVVMAGINNVEWLAAGINDPYGQWVAEHPTPEETYVITCQMDTRDIFSYREVVLDLQGSKVFSEINFARILSSTGRECKPVEPTISNILFAEAAAANWQLLEQNLGLDGGLDALNQLTGDWRGPPYAFPNSRNGLDDALGLVAALVVSRVNTSGKYVPAEDLSEGAYVFVQATRLGNGKGEALLLLIPPIITMIVLSLLMVNDLQKQHPQDYSMLDEDQNAPLKKSRPYSESLKELIQLGTQLGPRGLLHGEVKTVAQANSKIVNQFGKP